MEQVHPGAGRLIQAYMSSAGLLCLCSHVMTAVLERVSRIGCSCTLELLCTPWQVFLMASNALAGKYGRGLTAEG